MAAYSRYFARSRSLAALGMTTSFFGTVEEAAGKSGLIRHSLRSEESRFCGNPRKERFLTPQTPFGMTNWFFFHSV